METTFGYLNQVHGDLLVAAAHERSRRTSPPGRRPPTALIAAAVTVLAAAGLVGAIVRSGGIRAIVALDDAGSAARPAGPASTGTTGGEVPSATSAPGFDYTDEQGGNDGAGPDVGQSLSRVIRTAEISVVVPRDGFGERFSEAVDIAEANDGFVEDSRAQKRYGSLTIRVPSDNFDRALRALRALGTVEVQELHGKDVTADYVDLNARLRIARSRREVLLRLMDTATSIEQTIRVQNALDETQLRIEQLQGQLRVLDDQTSLATITLNIAEAGARPSSEIEKPSIPNALERAIAGFVGVIAAIVIGLGYLLPILAIAGVGWLVSTRLRRRRETP